MEAQRDELQGKLDAALKQLAANKNGGEAAARMDEMGQQMAGLRARLEILEARRIPYTAEELAMLSKPRGDNAGGGGGAPVVRQKITWATRLRRGRRN